MRKHCIISLVVLMLLTFSVGIVAAEGSPEKTAQETAESWLPLWDSGKYEESYGQLASLTKTKIPLHQWFVYWSAVRKPLGDLKSRKLIDTKYIKSLPGAPNQEGAVLRYESSFENLASLVETLGMMREKDGTWRVANYISPFKNEQGSPSAQSKSALEYFKEGSAYYLKRDYLKAIDPYEKALSLEKKQPSLEKKWWRVLIDNLGMSYGITGQLEKAKETFSYGLSKEPTYPLFHYNMSCTYAGLNDKGQAIAYLKSAFANKDNIIQGEKMPDPTTDDSFTKYMNDENFLKALKEIKGK